MSEMLEIDQVHLRTVMLCMSKMLEIDQIHLRTVMLCMSEMLEIDQVHCKDCNAMYVEDVAHNFLNT